MRACRVDQNHNEIVDALRTAGVSVQSLATIGKGCPDLVAAKGNQCWLIEVKGPKGKLTDDQIKFIGAWRGDVHIVRCPEDALRLVGVMA